jgi:hypothetical protein
MIDVIHALDLLDECVRDQATGLHLPDEAELPGALLAVAVGQSLATVRGFLQLPLVPEPRAGEPATKRETLSIGALIALRSADRMQRAGACWSCSAAAARRSVVAYVDLLPERLLGVAADQRRRRAAPGAGHHRCRARPSSRRLRSGSPDTSSGEPA